MNIKTCTHLWGFDLEKVLLPIGQCDQLMFTELLGTGICSSCEIDQDRIGLRIKQYYISLYNTDTGTLVISIENEVDKVLCSSVYTISKKLDGEYFILVNHKNRNKIENEYVETFTWSDTKGNLKEIIT